MIDEKEQVQGSSSLKGLFAWPEALLSQMDDLAYKNLIQHLQGGVDIRTHYSGMDAPLMALRTLVAALTMQGHPVGAEGLDKADVVRIQAQSPCYPRARKNRKNRFNACGVNSVFFAFLR